MATFNLQNNAVNAFFPKRRRHKAKICAFHHGYVKAAFWCEKRCCKIMQNLVVFLFDFSGFWKLNVDMKITVSQRRKCQQQCKHGRAQVTQPLGLFSFSQLPKAVSVCARDKLAH